MNKYFKYIIICLLLAGCNDDFLERAPLDALSDASFWTTQKDALSALNGCYKDWANGRNDAFYMDAASDNAYFQFADAGYTMLGNGTATATNTGYVLWNYTIIRRCNVFLLNIDRVDMDSKLKERYKAEVRFLRAYRYFLINRAYGDAPLVTKPLTILEANSVSKTPAKQLCQFILDELDEISKDDRLPYKYTNTTDIGRITRGAALALKARLELYDARYGDCINTCNAIMGSGEYALFPDYIDLFRIQNENNVEVLLDVQHMPDYYTFLLVNALAPNSAGGYSAVSPLQTLVDTYECTNGKTIDDPTSGYDPENPYIGRDPRLEATIIRPGTLYEGIYYDPITPGSVDYYTANNCSKTGYLCKKYISHLSDFKDKKNVDLNMIMIRYAEVLLSYAEAKIESGQIDQSVLDAINSVRARAYGVNLAETGKYPAITTTDQTELRRIIRRERRVELAMEGLRWYDIQRWRIGKETMSGTAYGTRLGTVDPNTGAVTYNTPDHIVVEQRVFDEDKNYLWPIPQSELDVNQNLKPNNPGY